LMRLAYSFFLFIFCIVLLFGCRVTRVTHVPYGYGEAEDEKNENAIFLNIDTGKQYQVPISAIKKQRLTSLCNRIYHILDGAGKYVGNKFYSKRSNVTIQQPYCDFDACLKQGRINDCHAKFIIRSDTTWTLTEKNAPTVTKEIILSDKYHATRIYHFMVKAYVSIWAKVGSDGRTPVTDIAINLKVYAWKQVPDIGAVWVPIKDDQIDRVQYEKARGLLKQWVQECTDKIILENQ